eukprot:634545-Hanusia_phi.AAC.2
MQRSTARRSANANALAAFHHSVAKGDIEKVKDFVQGKDRKPGHVRIAVDTQDEVASLPCQCPFSSSWHRTDSPQLTGQPCAGRRMFYAIL